MTTIILSKICYLRLYAQNFREDHSFLRSTFIGLYFNTSCGNSSQLNILIISSQRKCQIFTKHVYYLALFWDKNEYTE